jgi:hypothetical protein
LKLCGSSRANNLTFAIIRKNRQSRRGAVGYLERKNQVGWARCDAPGEIFWRLAEFSGNIGCQELYNSEERKIVSLFTALTFTLNSSSVPRAKVP